MRVRLIWMTRSRSSHSNDFKVQYPLLLIEGIDMKKCFKCNETKPLSGFYKHKGMRDGRLNKCKECTKRDSTKHRWENIEEVRSYDRSRGSRQSCEYAKGYRTRYPKKYAARTALNNAVRAGVIIPLPCEVCGSTYSVHGHHDDYSKQLNVRWLCAAHHKQWHEENGEGLNGE